MKRSVRNMGFILLGFISIAMTSLRADKYPSFADVVEPLLPAVVNISTTSDGGRDRQVMSEMPNFPPGSPLEELFRHFFDPEGGGRMVRPRKSHSLGSGFVIGQEGDDAYIVTCAHVIQDADEIKVIFHDDGEANAEVVGRDRRTDVAVLKVKTKKKLAVVEWGDSKKSRPGDWLIAIGNPFGLSSTVTVGVISSIARDIATRARALGEGGADYIDGYIQTDASINMGNSGGPMVNIDGKVIGISTAIFSPNGGNIGIGFAIPSDIAKGVVEQLRKYGRTKRGWLGVRIQNVSEGAAKALGLKKVQGALVGEISPSSPALKSGVKRGDVIIKFNDVDVKDSRALPRIVGETPIGKKVPMVVWRQGKEVTLDVNVGEFEEAEQEGLVGLEDQKAERRSQREGIKALGMVLQDLKPAIAERLNLGEGTKGAFIASIHPDSEAFQKGVRPGSVIMEVTVASKTEKVTKPEDFVEILKKARKDGHSEILLLLNGQGGLHFVALPTQDPIEKEKN